MYIHLFWTAQVAGTQFELRPLLRSIFAVPLSRLPNIRLRPGLLEPRLNHRGFLGLILGLEALGQAM
jgi:hypothetical protein